MSLKSPVVFIHGMYCGGWVWDSFRKPFEALGYTCFAPNLRHHDGASQPANRRELGTTGIADYVSDLKAFISDLSEKPILVGHSLGALIALKLAAILASKAVLINPGPPAGINTLDFVVAWPWRHILLSFPFWVGPSRLPFSLAQKGPLANLPIEEQKAIYQRLLPDSKRVFAETAFWFLDPHRTTWIDPGAIHCPMMMFAGAKDQMLPIKLARKTARKYAGKVTYIELPDRGHWIIGEPGWEEIADSIGSWLEAPPETEAGRPAAQTVLPALG